MGQPGEGAFQHDPIAGIGAVAEGGFYGELHKAGGPAHGHGEAVPCEQGAHQDTGVDIPCPRIGHRHIVAGHIPIRAAVPVVADVCHLPGCQLHPCDNHLGGSQLAEARQHTLGLGVGEGIELIVLLEENAGLGEVGGDDIRGGDQLGHPRL